MIVTRKILSVFRSHGLSVESQILPRIRVKSRYMSSVALGLALMSLLLLVLPNMGANGLRILLVIAIVSCMLSFAYTFYMSGGLPRRSQDEMLASLRDGVDPSLLCPSCNIVQSRAVHCHICNTCVADPYCQHSHLLATCITSRNRNGFIVFVTSLLSLDMILLMIAITNFRVEIIPGLQSGFDGPFNLVISAVFVVSVGTLLPLMQLLTQQCRYTSQIMID